MATSLELIPIQKAIKSILEKNPAVASMNTTVDIEPYMPNIMMPYIGIYHKNIALDITTISKRTFRISPLIDVECAVEGYEDSLISLFESRDLLTGYVLRALIDNQTLNNTVLTSAPTGIETILGKKGATTAYIAMTTITMELTISFT